MGTRIAIDTKKIAQFCRRHHISRLALFGSVLGDDFRADSDVDVLVEFDPQHVPGFFAMHEIENELSEIVGGHKADVVTYKSLNHRIRDRVLASSEVQYGEG